MSEYIVVQKQIKRTDGTTEGFRAERGEEIVRCRDCKYYYEADNYHPWGNVLSHCCKYFDAYNDEVEPNGFCAWAERKEVGDE